MLLKVNIFPFCVLLFNHQGLKLLGLLAGLTRYKIHRSSAYPVQLQAGFRLRLFTYLIQSKIRTRVSDRFFVL